MLLHHKKLTYIWSAFLLIVCLGAAVLPGRAQVYLFNRNDFGDGGIGSGMAAGDFNGDGRTDFVVTFVPYTGPGFVRIFLGQPDGTLTVGNYYDSGTSPNSVVVGDFNGDGKLDFAVANAGDDTISIYLGNGDGTFSGPATYPTGPTPWWIITGDFNGDGKVDLATSGGNGSTVSVLLGNGDGTFQPHIDSPTLPYAAGLAAGDFNGDGKLDLVVGAANAFCVLLGNGDGTFQPPVQVASFNGSQFAVGDFNGDGKLDIAALSINTTAVVIYLGNGDGTFQAGARYGGTAQYGDSLVAADFNDDGKLDLAFTNYDLPYGANSAVVVLIGNGDGTFQGPTVYGAAGGGTTSIVAADVNGDGHLDLAVSNSMLLTSQAKTISVLLGRGDGTFSGAHKDYWAGTPGPTIYNYGGVFMGDFNGDGKPDVGELFADSSTSNVEFGIALSNGDGTFQAPKTTTIGPYATVGTYGPLVGDFNNDGKLDLAMVVNVFAPELLVFLGNGDGTFQPPISTPLSNVTSFAIGDFNGDGKLDVAYVGQGSNHVGVLLGRGDGTFGSENDFATGATPEFVTAADLRNNGKLDLVVGLSSPLGPSISVLLGKGDGTFPTHSDIGQGYASVIAVADVNGDGKPDLILAGQVMLGNGDGTFQNGKTYDSALVAQIVIADMNGDGKPDIVTADGGPTFSVRYGNGDGTFSPAVAYRDLVQGSVVVADFNGDGAEDLAVPSSTAVPAFSVYLNTPMVALYPTPLDFGTQALRIRSATKDVTLYNPGSMPLTITGIRTGGDFQAVDACGKSLAVGVDCDIEVSFTPKELGVRNNALQVADNAPGSPQVVNLIGTGVPPVILPIVPRCPAAGGNWTPGGCVFSPQPLGR
jgi:hypothetical protein